MKIVLGVALGLALASIQPDIPAQIQEYVHDIADYIAYKTKPDVGIVKWGN